MKASDLKYSVLSVLTMIIIVVISLMPFHAFLTVWGNSLVGHYTLLRLWKEFLLLISIVGVIYLLLTDSKIRIMTLSRRLVQLIIVYLIIDFLLGLVALKFHQVNTFSLGYGWIVDTRFLLFFLVVWSIALRTNKLQTKWLKLILWPATIVVGFGLLEVFVLPKNFLSFFGYGPHTIMPYETINNNQKYIRILSTLRGANPLGAYLLIPLSALAVLIIRGKRNWFIYLYFIATCVVLFFSFSRSAWVGAVLSLLTIIIASFPVAKIKKLLIYIGLGTILLISITTLLLNNNKYFQNLTYHSQVHSKAPISSDQAHFQALKNGLKSLASDPFGKGPGSAGPASVYNNHPARIAENFYIQIGQEIGWLGLGLFLLINIGVGYILWLGRQNPLALILFASFVGLSFVNMLSHAWADDTLAYVWWGLAGIAISTLSKSPLDTSNPSVSSVLKKLKKPLKNKPA